MKYIDLRVTVATILLGLVILIPYNLQMFKTDDDYTSKQVAFTISGYLMLNTGETTVNLRTTSGDNTGLYALTTKSITPYFESGKFKIGNCVVLEVDCKIIGNTIVDICANDKDIVKQFIIKYS